MDIYFSTQQRNAAQLIDPIALVTALVDEIRPPCASQAADAGSKSYAIFTFLNQIQAR
jgi:hypothetical protein